MPFWARHPKVKGGERAGFELCPGGLRPPTFVPNSDGTVAARERLVLAGEPNGNIPGLRRRGSKDQLTQESMRGRGGACHPERGSRTAHTPPKGSACPANPGQVRRWNLGTKAPEEDRAELRMSLCPSICVLPPLPNGSRASLI